MKQSVAAILLALMAALIIGLGTIIGYGISALIVGIVVAVVSVILIISAINALKNVEVMPRQTVETIKEDAK